METPMKRLFTTLGLAALLAATAIPAWTAPAYAGNSSVEATIESFGDLSMFYQGLLNSGVINELNENQHYTIFAPVNPAFAEVQPQTYPCFYAVQCRPQIAVLLRNHIVSGGYGLKELVSYGQGIETIGGRHIFVQEPYVNDYAVDGKTILSKSEANGNMIYRINGVIAIPQELAPFRTVSYQPPEKTVTKTITTYTTQAPGMNRYPAGTMAEPAGGVPDDVTEKTTIINTTTGDQ
jgi:uncharacterized surface protein with fasciclin (FAS1) repeats